MVDRTFQNTLLSNPGMGAMRLSVINGDDSQIDEAAAFRMAGQAMGLMSLPEEKKPSACIGCRSCEKVCLQQIRISEAMKDFSVKANW